MRQTSSRFRSRFAGFTVIEAALAVAVLGTSLVVVQSSRLDDKTEAEAMDLANHLQVIGEAARRYWIYFGGSHLLRTDVDILNTGGTFQAGYLNAFYGSGLLDNLARNALGDSSAQAWPRNLRLLANRGFLAKERDWFDTRWGALSSSSVSGRNTWGRSGYVITLAIASGKEDIAMRAATYLDMPYAITSDPLNGALSLSVQFFSPLQAPLGSIYSYALLARGQPHLMLNSIHANGFNVSPLPRSSSVELPEAYNENGVFTFNNSGGADVNFSLGIGDLGSNVTIVTPYLLNMYPVWQASDCALNSTPCLEQDWMDPLDSGNYWHADMQLPGDVVIEPYAIITGGAHGITEYTNATVRNKSDWVSEAAPVFVNDIQVNVLFMRWACIHDNGSLDVDADRTCLHTSTEGTRFDRLTTINDVADRNWKYDPVNMGHNRGWPEYSERRTQLISDARLKTGLRRASLHEFTQAHAESRNLSTAGVAKVMQKLNVAKAENQTVTDAAVLSTMWATATSIDGELEVLNQDIDELLRQSHPSP